MNTYHPSIDELAASVSRAKNNGVEQRQTAPVSSTQLLGKDGVLEILHDGQLYLLRKTSTGKLILTK